MKPLFDRMVDSLAHLLGDHVTEEGMLEARQTLREVLVQGSDLRAVLAASEARVAELETIRERVRALENGLDEAARALAGSAVKR